MGRGNECDRKQRSMLGCGSGQGVVTGAGGGGRAILVMGWLCHSAGALCHLSAGYQARRDWLMYPVQDPCEPQGTNTKMTGYMAQQPPPPAPPHTHTRPADTRRWINVGLTLVQRSRRWTNVKTTLIQRRVSAGNIRCSPNAVLIFGQRRRQWPSIKTTLGHCLVLLEKKHFNRGQIP